MIELKFSSKKYKNSAYTLTIGRQSVWCSSVYLISFVREDYLYGRVEMARWLNGFLDYLR
jgi:hypothetical protein